MPTPTDVVLAAVEPVGGWLLGLSAVGLGIGVAVFAVRAGWHLLQGLAQGYDAPAMSAQDRDRWDDYSDDGKSY